jgi:peptidoglycan hydrolase-like protein with peptidoglycan-binding domain
VANRFVPVRVRSCIVLAGSVAALLVASPSALGATAAGSAALQVALAERGLYRGPVDGIAGPATTAAVRELQRRAGITVDGVAGPQTRAALGRLGRPLPGTRPLRRGAVGWDVSALQFLLAQRGHSVRPDGHFGPGTEAAVRAHQQRAGLAVDGIAGPATLAALRGTATTAARAAPRPAGRRHVVRPGETLTAIAARYGTTVGALARANRLDPTRVLLVATPLQVPVAGARPGAGQAHVRRLIESWSRYYGVDPRLLTALAWQESGFQQQIVSSAGAFGVMQVTPETWQFVEAVLVGRPIPRTLAGNVRVGVAFFRHLLQRFGGDVRLALGAYFRGPAAVERFGLGPETRRYVANVLALRDRV